MVNPFINSITSWFLKKRIHQIELFIKYPNEVQNELLLKLLSSAKNTSIGKLYGFDSIKNYKDYSERVPVSTYEEISEMIERSRKEKKIFFGVRILNGLQNLAELQILKANSFLSAKNL